VHNDLEEIAELHEQVEPRWCGSLARFYLAMLIIGKTLVHKWRERLGNVRQVRVVLTPELRRRADKEIRLHR